jgi:phosphonoacetate hydrolase
MRTTRPSADTDVLESALCDPSLSDRVEMVLSAPGPDTYRAASATGSVEFVRRADRGDVTYERTATSGSDPLADQSTDRFLGLAAEAGALLPAQHENSYPHAFDSVAQFFDAPHSPDLVALHTAAHYYGHLGQHGSLAAVQARAPFIAAGQGVRCLGTLDETTRVIDIAPTIASVIGVEPNPVSVGPTGEPRPGGLLRRQDGEVEQMLLDGSVARHAVVFLLDGCNANLLADVIASGEAPNLAAIASRGTTYARGAISSLPTATLANHTSAITGAHPGHSGILHNEWIDGDTSDAVDLLELDQMFHAMQHLSPRVETLFQAVKRSRPGAFTSASFEFCDTGADFSTFGLARSGDPNGLPGIDDVSDLDADSATNDGYAFMSRVDHLSMTHTIECWEGAHGNGRPTLSWCSLALTDEAGHESGPHGTLARAAVRDGDARIGRVLAAVERAGALDDTAVFVVADHGMEQSDPELDEPWDDALASTGVAYREVGDGLIYLGH